MTEPNLVLIDDRDLRPEVPWVSPTCYSCARLLGYRRCQVFDWVPEPIWKGEHDHRTYYRGDGGITYAPRSRLNSLKFGGPGSGNWGHLGREGEHGGSAEGTGGSFDVSEYPANFKDISKEQLMAQANYNDIRATMRKDLAAIRRGDAKVEPVSGPVDRMAVATIINNARAEITTFTGYLASDCTDRLHRYTNLLEGQLKSAADDLEGVDAADLNDMVRDSVEKLVYQEVESNRQQFTDHGIRHITSNIENQSDIQDALISAGVEISPRERLLGTMVMVNHDVGYTTPLVREGGLRGIMAAGHHSEMGSQIYEEQRELWDADRIFSGEEYDRAVELIGTHQAAMLDVADPVGLSTRLADNLSLFAPEKLPSMFRYVPGGEDILVDLGEAMRDGDEQAFEAGRQELLGQIKESGLEPNLQRDLSLAVDQMNIQTPKFTMGTLAGEISSIQSSPEALIEVNIQHNELDEVLQRHFDMGQKQLDKFLKDYGITDRERQTEFNIGELEGKPIIKINVYGVDPATLVEPPIMQFGGPGSGNWGHSGVDDVHGGSSEGSGPTHTRYGGRFKTTLTRENMVRQGKQVNFATFDMLRDVLVRENVTERNIFYQSDEQLERAGRDLDNPDTLNIDDVRNDIRGVVKGAVSRSLADKLADKAEFGAMVTGTRGIASHYYDTMLDLETEINNEASRIGRKHGWDSPEYTEIKADYREQQELIMSMQSADKDLTTARHLHGPEKLRTIRLEPSQLNRYESDLEDRVRARLAKYGYLAEVEAAARESMCSAIIGQWAETSADHVPAAVAMQMVAASEFRLSGAKFDHLPWEAREKAREQYGQHKEAMGQFLRAQYEQTQEFLADAGIESVTVYRGMVLRPQIIDRETYKPIGPNEDYDNMRAVLVPDEPAPPYKQWSKSATTELSMQPMSSASYLLGEATVFGNPGSGGLGIIAAAEIPAERILSTPLTGTGCLSEAEIIVLGGTDEWRVAAYDKSEFTQMPGEGLAGRDWNPTEQLTGEGPAKPNITGRKLVLFDETFALGGEGSGHHDHDGLAGVWGGSLPGPGAADSALQSLTDKAKRYEPAITAAVTDVANKIGAKMEGLKYRLKTEKSLKDKLQKYQREDSRANAQQLERRVRDSVRYTMTFEEDKYAQGIMAAEKEMRQAGFQLTEARNYWPKSEAELTDTLYMGVNTNWTNDQGFVFELQLHTPSSWECKEFRTHADYKALEQAETESTKERLMKAINTKWRAIAVPAGVGAVTFGGGP